MSDFCRIDGRKVTHIPRAPIPVKQDFFYFFFLSNERLKKYIQPPPTPSRKKEIIYIYHNKKQQATPLSVQMSQPNRSG